MKIEELYRINRIFKTYCTCKNVLFMLNTNTPNENLRIAIVNKDNKILDTIEDSGGLVSYYNNRLRDLEKVIEGL